MTKEKYSAPAIECEGCSNAIQRSLGKLKGIQKVEVDIKSKQVTVQFDESALDEKAILARLDAAGYPAQKIA